MFSGFTSQWEIPFLCRCARADSSCRATLLACCSAIGVRPFPPGGTTRPCSSPPGRYSART